jgi:hypothetical protein
VSGLMSESEFSIYGKGIMKVKEAIVHAFLYANLAENVGKHDY